MGVGKVSIERCGGECGGSVAFTSNRWRSEGTVVAERSVVRRVGGAWCGGNNRE